MMTTSTAAGYESDISGLICAFRFTPDGPGAELDSQALAQRLADSANESEEGDFLWLHMNLSQAGCVRWLQAHLELPDAFIAMLGEAAHSTRIEQQERALVAVFNDVIFDFERTPAQVATLCVREAQAAGHAAPSRCARWTGCASMCAGASASVRRPSCWRT